MWHCIPPSKNFSPVSYKNNSISRILLGTYGCGGKTRHMHNLGCML